MRLQLRNPNPGNSSDFYIDRSNITEADVRDAISNPQPRNGGCLMGDVEIYFSSELSPKLQFYLGIPDRIAVMIHDPAYTEKWFLVNEEGRKDLFLLCPDTTPGQWWRLPQSSFHQLNADHEFISKFFELEKICINKDLDEINSQLSQFTSGGWQKLLPDNDFDITEDSFY